ncbi:hypothetical protein GGX14DRAFT_403805 [Mycena pura]|uniref:Uncharacterized protein n=1 Tax=Mycena pura TaxID=153505 RepID=A0AAD6UXC7_9AGAR|nr:hypothetical protein GGX14DRAFT_403805 [Mycena pura]
MIMWWLLRLCAYTHEVGIVRPRRWGCPCRREASRCVINRNQASASTRRSRSGEHASGKQRGETKGVSQRGEYAPPVQCTVRARPIGAVGLDGEQAAAVHREGEENKAGNLQVRYVVSLTKLVSQSSLRGERQPPAGWGSGRSPDRGPGWTTPAVAAGAAKKATKARKMKGKGRKRKKRGKKSSAQRASAASGSPRQGRGLGWKTPAAAAGAAIE